MLATLASTANPSRTQRSEYKMARAMLWRGIRLEALTSLAEIERIMVYATKKIV